MQLSRKKFIVGALLLLTLGFVYKLRQPRVVKDDPDKKVMAVEFSPDSRALLITYQDEKQDYAIDDFVQLRDVQTGKLLRTLKGTAAAFFKDSTHVTMNAKAGQEIWDIKSGKRLRTLKQINGVELSRDGKLLAAFHTKNSIFLYDTRTWRKKRALKIPDNSLSMDFSRDDKFFAAGGMDAGSQTKMSNPVGVWDVESGKREWMSKEVNQQYFAVAFSPDGKILAAGGQKGLALRSTQTGKLLRPIYSNHGSWTHSISFSSDGKFMVTAHSGGDAEQIQVWDVKTGKVIRFLRSDHQGIVNAVAFSPDGRMIASGSDDHTVDLWDAKTGKLLLIIGRRENQYPGLS